MTAGWQIKKLGDVCKTGAGGTPLKSVKEFYEGGDIPWLMSGEVSQGEIYNATNFITQKGLDNSSAKIFPKDTVLVAMYGATAGQTGILRFQASTNQAVCGIYPNENFLPEFIYYCLFSKKDELISQAIGNAQPNISQEKIRNTEIPIPSLPEQKRIVTILDHAFEGIAKATANAEKNLANARELFKSSLQSVFLNEGNTWTEKKLGTFSRISYGYTEKASFQPIGPRFLRITDIQENRVDWSSVPFCKIDPSDLVKYKLADGDIVFARTGATTGKSYLIKNPPEAVFASYLIKVQMLDSTILSPDFLYLFFQSNRYWDVINSGMSGSAQGGFNATKLSELVVPIPSASEQDLVVAKFAKLSAEIKRLETVCQQKLVALVELKKSILNQAFSGELKN